MTMSSESSFDVLDADLGPVESGTSVLLTGSDAQALEAAFYRLLAAPDDERTLVLATDTDGRSVNRALGDVLRGASERASVMTCSGPDRGENVSTVDDLTDLTGLGMELSEQIASSTAGTDTLRTGIFLCSTICGAVDDVRSLYRFLNSTFLTSLRRNDAMGVCAIDTSADVGTDLGSVVAGMSTSFTGRVDVEPTGTGNARVVSSDVSGFPEGGTF